MGKQAELVKAWTDAGSIEHSAPYLADDFQSYDRDGNVQFDRATWVGMGHMLEAAFTDFKWVRTKLREEGDSVIMTGHFEGTHTGDLDLSAMGFGIVPASGKKIVWPDSRSKVSVKDGKIARSRDIGETGGLETFLGALGIEPPVA